MPESGSIRAGRAVVEIAGNKDSFERAVVDSQAVLDTFAGAIDAAIAPVQALQGKIDSLATVGAGLAGKLGFGDIAVSLETASAGAGAFVGQASGVVSAVADTATQFGKLQGGVGAAFGELASWGRTLLSLLGPVGTAIAGVVTVAAAATVAVFNLRRSAAEEAGAAMEKQAAEARGFRDAQLAYQRKMDERRRIAFEVERDERRKILAETLKRQDEEGNRRAELAQKAREDFSRTIAEGQKELEKLKTPAQQLADYIAKIRGLQGERALSGPQAAELIDKESQRLAGKNLGPQEAVDTPAQALASSALRGSAEAAETIARSQAAILKTDSKADEQVAQQRRTNELLSEGNKIARQRAGTNVEIFSGN